MKEALKNVMVGFVKEWFEKIPQRFFAEIPDEVSEKFLKGMFFFNESLEDCLEEIARKKMWNSP